MKRRLSSGGRHTDVGCGAGTARVWRRRPSGWWRRTAPAPHSATHPQTALRVDGHPVGAAFVVTHSDEGFRAADEVAAAGSTRQRRIVQAAVSARYMGGAVLGERQAVGDGQAVEDAYHGAVEVGAVQRTRPGAPS
jgi:hypothetical protein